MRARRAVPPTPSPIPGWLLIADRGNNRILLVDNAGRILWRYPRPGRAAYPFRFDDDAFFGPRLRTIVSNQEEQHTIQIVAFPSGKLVWSYGHPDVRGSAPRYLNTPDDAYKLPDGLVSVADAYNCRVLFLAPSGRIVRQIGTAGACYHDPPRALGPVNGATPLPGGGVLVSEVAGSWIDAFAARGRLLWSFRAPVSYPSDPQWLGHGHVLLADYARPGHALIVDTHGRVLWRYGPSSGPGELDHPSLALRIRPGLIGVTDDYRHRVVLIDLRTKRIVWQYGHTDRKGTAGGYLNTPDGMDVLPFRRVLALPALRRLVAPARRSRKVRAASGLVLRRAGFRLPVAVERAVAAGWRGRIVIAGGLDEAGRSAAGVFALDPASGSLRSLGALPLPFHDAAAAVRGDTLLVFGGGAASSRDTVQAFDLRSRTGKLVGRLPRPLSDLAAASAGGVIYLVGGFDGGSPRPEILATRDGTRFATVARLPVGLRYPAVAVVGGRVLVAGGETAGGLSSAVYAFDPRTRAVRRVATLPRPVAHAEAVVVGGRFYVVGGLTAAGAPAPEVVAVSPRDHAVRAVPAPAAAVADAAAARVGAKTFLVGGRRRHPLTSVLAARGG